MIPFLISLSAGVAFGAAAYVAGALNGSGAVVGGLLAATFVLLGGWPWIVPGVVFFVTSSALSRVGRRRKEDVAHRVEKGERRDAAQVLANGGVTWACLLGTAFVPEVATDPLYVAGLGALAAATADTWATEVGTLASGQPRSLRTLQPVPPGTSGGVSLVGTAAAGLGAALVAASAVLLWEGGSPAWILTTTLAGLAGTFVDSLVGATLQARYRDPATGEWTERRPVPYRPPDRGLPGVTNDVVNALGTSTGGAVALLLHLL